MVGLPYGDKNFEDMFNRLDRIPACDRQSDRRADGQTSCHGIDRAMHMRRAVIKLIIIVIIIYISIPLSGFYEAGSELPVAFCVYLLVLVESLIYF